MIGGRRRGMRARGRDTGTRTAPRLFVAAALAIGATACATTHGRASEPASAPPAAAVGDTTRGATHGAASGRRRRQRQAKTPPPPKRAKVGERVPVQITYYCLQGTTRTDHPTREGIIAADPRVFPLHRHVELFRHGKSLGRFLVDDTGDLVRGHIVDVWVPSCHDARRRGRRRGVAVLLKKGVATEGLAATK
ncbi:MAG TPA: hypothetical protein VNS52_18550 [Gemmatimonadaceae bacterium]|nr:hypothetical protein [Gemmatimonadaceae bacterium]